MLFGDLAVVDADAFCFSELGVRGCVAFPNPNSSSNSQQLRAKRQQDDWNSRRVGKVPYLDCSFLEPIGFREWPEPQPNP